MNTHKKTLATTSLILMAGFFLMITMPISSPAQEIRGTADRVEQQMGDKPPGQDLLPDDPIQHDMRPDMDRVRLSMEDIKEKSHEKSTGVRFKVDSDALINGVTVGRGGGNILSNTASGRLALDKNTSGMSNTASGAWALRDNTKGSYNTAIGRSALLSNIDNSRSTAIGFEAMRYADDRTPGRETYNTAVGYQALRGSTTAANNTGQYNTAIGDQALYSNTSGWSNTATGAWALQNNTTGDHNTATGLRTLLYNTTGSENTATGRSALVNNTSGSENTATGRSALQNNTTGSSNTASGWWALFHNTTGNNNTAVGDYAGAVRTNIQRGTFLGKSAYAGANDLTNVTGIGYNARPNGSNTIHLGNTSVAHIKGQVDFTKFSDGSYKTNISEDVAGLDFILRLRPVSYNVDIHKLAVDVGEDERFDKDGNKAESTPDEFTLKSRDEQSAVREVGFVAQEVEALVQEMDVAFNGVDAPQNETGKYGLRYASFVVPLVNAVQEQQAQIELLEPAAVEALQVALEEMQTENAGMKQQLQEVRDENLTLEAKTIELENKVDQILALLRQQGIELGSGLTNDPTRSTPERNDRNTPSQTAQLEQNAPNPFQENTVIRYFLPENTARAQLIITDLQGNRIHTKVVEGDGFGEITIEGGSLSKGTYVYSLVVNGQLIDSKRMVLL